MKHLILGDVHLGRSLSIGKPGASWQDNSRLKDQNDLLLYVSGLCIERGIEHIIITGDVYQDAKPHPALIDMFMGWLKVCENAKIIVDIIAGNHDIMRSGMDVTSALDLITTMKMPLARFYKYPTSQDYGDICFTYAPYRDKRMFEEENTEQILSACLNQIPKPTSNKINILVGHLSLQGSIGVGDEIGDSLNEIFIPAEDLSSWSHVWMGHIHNPQVILKGSPYAAHVGSMDRSDFGVQEIEGPKTVVVIDPSSESLFEHVELPTRTLRNISISVPSDKDSTEYVINTLYLDHKNTSLKDAIIKLEVQLSGDAAEDVDRKKVEKFLKEKIQAHHICNFSETRKISVVELDPENVIDNTMSTEVAINKWVDSRSDLDDERKQKVKNFMFECSQMLEEKIK